MLFTIDCKLYVSLPALRLLTSDELVEEVSHGNAGLSLEQELIQVASLYVQDHHCQLLFALLR